MKKILVIDDDRASCELLSEILTAHGWETANDEMSKLKVQLPPESIMKQVTSVKVIKAR